MSLKTKVKAGNITNLSDARYCAGMGVDWLGFPADSIDPKTFAEITGWVTGPQFVLELSADAIPKSISEYAVDIIQVNYQQLQKREILANHQLIVALSITDWNLAKAELIKNKDQIQQILLLNLTGNKTEDVNILTEIDAHTEVLISLEACPYSLPEILDFPITGINIAGNNELKPGLKDYTELAEVLEQLENE
jgi:phosphoribosylanthranilate isomerase